LNFVPGKTCRILDREFHEISGPANAGASALNFSRFVERPDGPLIMRFHIQPVAEFGQPFSRPADNHLGVSP
jgi:hypothetical protein